MTEIITKTTETGAEGAAILCDTLCRISIFGNKSTELIENTFRLCRALEKDLSKFSGDGDIQRLNASAAGCGVSQQTAELLKLALSCRDISGGAFDVTARQGHVSNSGDLSVEGCTVIKRPGVRVDLGGIAKGYITDAAAGNLRNTGIAHAMLDFGGNVVVVGGSPSGRPWNVGLRDPRGGPDSFFAVVAVTDASVVTSAEYERGKHIIDPGTGKPADAGCVSATVIARSSAFADALATALFVGGENLLKKMENRPGAESSFEAVIVKKSGHVFFTSGLEKRISFCSG